MTCIFCSLSVELPDSEADDSSSSSSSSELSSKSNVLSSLNRDIIASSGINDGSGLDSYKLSRHF